MLDQYLTIEMLHKSWSLFLFQELNYMYLILLSSSFNNFSRGIQLNTLYFSCGKDNLISNVNVNILCLVHKPVCRSTVLWQFTLHAWYLFFCEWLLLYLIVTFGNLIQYHLKHWLLDIEIYTVLGRINNKWITKIEVTCH